MSTAAFAVAVLVSLVVLFAPRAGGAGSVPHLDKVVHAAVFGLLTGTGVWRFGRREAVLAGGVVYAVLSEVVQHTLLPERSGDVADVVADVVGAVLGVVVAARVVAGRAGHRGRA
ncbi:hypothetical protein NUM3379_43070 [Kineococcus sp. NUM-3379]